MKTSTLLVTSLLLGAVASPAVAQKAAAPGKGAAPAPALPASAAPAAPAPPPPPTTPTLADTLTGTAKADYEAGKLLFGVSDYAAALIKFTSAHDASKDPRLYWNIASCEGKLHHYAKAVGMLRTYLKDGGTLLSDQDRYDATQTMSAMEPLTSTMRVTSSEDGAEVYLDDALIGKTPLDPMLVDIGVHKVRLHKAEFDEATEEVTVSGGATLLVDLKLKQTVHEGRVSVSAGPKDTIAIDGQPVGVGQWAGALHSGGHTLRVTAQSMLPYQSEVLVQDGQTRTISVTLNPEPSKGLPAWVWVGGSVLVAGGLGTGAYFLFKPSPQYNGPVGNLGTGVVQASSPVKF
jgi:hypothetical protein